MDENKVCSVFPIKVFVISISILAYLGYVLLYSNMRLETDQSNLIFILSWAGIFTGFYIIMTWYRITKTVFSLYTIFMLFFFLFNYGQPLMWAFGIHQFREIGQTSLYTLGIPNTAEIALSQAITLTSIVLFHLGAVFCYKGKHRNSYRYIKTKSDSISRLALYNTSFILSLISIPVTFYNVIYKLNITRAYGYRSFYHNEEVVNNIVAFNLIDNLFFPCLVGLLIGSNYKKKTRIFVYIVFFVYMLLSLLSGDRGTWIIKLIILIWMSHSYYHKISLRKFLKLSVVTVVGLQFLDAVVSVRNSGINLFSILKTLSFKDSALVSAVFEMGSSMRPTIVLMKYGWNIWPYGNTYLNALLGMASSRVLSVIGRPWASVSSWFSNSYLGISYGSGFSIVAESLLNYGPIFSPLFMILLGYIVVSLTYLDNRININNNPTKVFFAISTFSFLTGIIRNHVLLVTKSWFYGVVVFMFFMYFMRDYTRRKSKNSNKSI